MVTALKKMSGKIVWEHKRYKMIKKERKQRKLEKEKEEEGESTAKCYLCA